MLSLVLVLLTWRFAAFHMYLRKLYVIVGWTKDEDESLSTCDGQIYVMFCSRRGGPKCTHEGEVNKRKKAEKKTG